MFEERASFEEFLVALEMRDVTAPPPPPQTSWSEWENVKWNLRAARDAADL